jgi:hypothetical protein
VPATDTAKVTLLPTETQIGLFVVCHATLGRPITVSNNACVTVADDASVTFMVKLNVPFVVGVPEITPLVDKLNPGANAPELFVQL